MTPKEKAAQVLAADKYAILSGVELAEAEVGYAVCTMRITENHRNAAGGVQGGAIFTLADTTFAMAANNQDNLTVSLNNSISYLKNSKGSVLIATARLISATRRTCVYEIEVKDDLNELIAKMTGTGYIKGEKHLHQSAL